MGQRRYEQLADRAWLQRRYLEEVIPVTGIAAEVGCTEATVRHALAVAGVARRPRGAQRVYRALTDEGWLRRRYVQEAASVADIAAQIGLGCNETTVRNALRAAAIPLVDHRRRCPELADTAWLCDSSTPTR